MTDRLSRPTLIVFSGGMRATAVERLIGDARDAAALDLLDRGLETNAFGGSILVTDSAALAQAAPRPVEVVLEAGAFDFDATLRRLVRERRLLRPFYVGGGSIPLVETAELAALATRLVSAEDMVISNNFFSADFVAWTPGTAIDAISHIPSDNRLPQLLHTEAGLASWSMERSIASQFDIDLPADLAILKLYGGGGPRLRSHLDGLDLDLSPFRRAMAHFLLPSTVVVAGRVGSATWQFLERETMCRVRVFSEERGMQADGREAAGLVRSVLGFLTAQVGEDGLFEMLAALGDAVFFDTRVLFAHAHASPSRPDRFLSDLGRWQEVTDPFVRNLTRAALSAPVPVVLGGHSLVSAGIMALVQAAWAERDRGTTPG